MRAAAILAAGLACLGPASAAAQGRCAPAEGLRGWLATEHGERPVFSGLARGAVIELWLGDGGGWTLLAVLPDGRACFLGAGEAGALVPQPPPGREG